MFVDNTTFWQLLGTAAKSICFQILLLRCLIILNVFWGRCRNKKSPKGTAALQFWAARSWSKVFAGQWSDIIPGMTSLVLKSASPCRPVGSERSTPNYWLCTENESTTRHMFKYFAIFPLNLSMKNHRMLKFSTHLCVSQKCAFKSFVVMVLSVSVHSTYLRPFFWEGSDGNLFNPNSLDNRGTTNCLKMQNVKIPCTSKKETRHTFSDILGILTFWFLDSCKGLDWARYH